MSLPFEKVLNLNVTQGFIVYMNNEICFVQFDQDLDFFFHSMNKNNIITNTQYSCKSIKGNWCEQTIWLICV